MDLIKVSIIVLLSLAEVTAHAQNTLRMSEIEIFNRCYNRFVKKPLPTSGTSTGYQLATKVQKGTVTGSAACAELLASADFATTGILKNSSSDEARRILETFHNLHISFFGAPALSNFTNFANMTLLLKDVDEPALYFTQALFGNKAPATIVTSTETLRSVRESNLTANKNYDTRSINPFAVATYVAGEDPRRLAVWEHDVAARDAQGAKDLIHIRDVAYKADMDAAVAAKNDLLIAEINAAITAAVNTTRVIKTQLVPDTRFIGQGPLLGVQAQTSLFAPIQPLRTSINANGSVATITTDYKAHNVHWHLGGGVLGTQMYMLKNTNLGVNSIVGNTTANDTYTNVPRRFTSKIFEDLLCHTLPTLTEADVKADVDTKSVHGFKTTASCMRCHSSFDPLVGVYRNIIVGQSTTTLANQPRYIPARQRGSPIVTLVKLQSTGTNIFALKPPTGSLRFRDHSGALVNKSLSSVAQLGTEISNSGDFYRCMAKKYYHFLTGVNVNLTANSAQISAEAKKHKDFVYLLGRILQGSFANNNEKAAYQSQQKSIKGMINVILNSDAFVRRDSGTLGE